MARSKKEDTRLHSVTEKLLGAFEELDFLHSLAVVLANPAEIEDLDRYLLDETQRIFEADCGWVLRTATARGSESRLSPRRPRSPGWLWSRAPGTDACPTWSTISTASACTGTSSCLPVCRVPFSPCPFSFRTSFSG